MAVGEHQGRWTDTIDLQTGDLIWQTNGTTGVVKSVKVVAREQRMYNLSVDVAHTFFVGDGQWLVHNAGPCGFLSRPFANNADLNKNMIEEMFRGKWVGGQWVSSDTLPGGLAGAIRRELANPGNLVGGRSHITKGQDRLNGLKRILENGQFNGQTLDQHDLDVVRSLHDDLLNALQGQ